MKTTNEDGLAELERKQDAEFIDWFEKEIYEGESLSDVNRDEDEQRPES